MAIKWEVELKPVAALVCNVNGHTLKITGDNKLKREGGKYFGHMDGEFILSDAKKSVVQVALVNKARGK